MDTNAQNTEKTNLGSLLFLIAFAALISLPELGDTTTFSHPDEALYMRIASEMFHGHQWWVPTWFGDYAFYKPPLTYWLMMCSFSLLGISEMAARLPSAFSVVLTAVFVYFMGKKLFDEKAGFLAGLLFATSFGIIAYGRSAMMDLPLVCLMTGALLCFLHAAEGGRPFHLMAFFLLTSLSCLIKGPVSAVILTLSAVSWCIIFRRLSLFRTPISIAGGLMVLAMNALWPLMLSFRGLFNHWLIFFIFRENAGKFGDSVSYSPLIIPGSLLFYLLPWTGLFIASLTEMAKTRSYREKETAFLLLWGAAVFIIYLIPQVRHQYYVLPIIPAAALLMAGTLYRIKSGFFPLYGRLLTCLCVACPLAILPFFVRLFGAGAFSWPFLLTELFLACTCLSLFIDAKALKRFALSPAILTPVFFGLATVSLIIASPRYGFDIFPPAAQKAITSEEIAVAGYESYIFAERSGKRTTRVQASYHANDFLGRDTCLIIPESLMTSFKGENEDNLRPVEVFATWKYWKRTVSINELLGALGKGDISSLIEEHYVVRKK